MKSRSALVISTHAEMNFSIYAYIYSEYNNIPHPMGLNPIQPKRKNEKLKNRRGPKARADLSMTKI